MSATFASRASGRRSAAAPVELPVRLKLLCIAPAGSAGRWLADAFAADAASQVQFEQAAGISEGIGRLRDEAFDGVLAVHSPSALDAIEFAEGFRAGGHEDPLIILGADRPQDVDAICYEAGADDYCCLAETTVRSLLWKLARAMQRYTLARENRRLIEAERQRLRQEHREAERLLAQQRALIEDLKSLEDGGTATDGEQVAAACSATINLAGALEEHPPKATELPRELQSHYRGLLRAYVIMGAGNLGREMALLAELLVAGGATAQQALQLHVAVLEELIAGLGNRSARHVMNRADLLVMEVMRHLADGYRERYYDRLRPPRQQLLPGFDEFGVLKAA